MDPAFNGAVTLVQRVSQAKRGKCKGSVKQVGKKRRMFAF